MVEEGCGIIAIIVLPILLTQGSDKLVREISKTKTCYNLSSITIILYILSVVVFKIVNYHGIDSLFSIIYNFIAVLVYTIAFIKK